MPPTPPPTAQCVAPGRAQRVGWACSCLAVGVCPPPTAPGETRGRLACSYDNGSRSATQTRMTRDEAVAPARAIGCPE